MLERTTKFIIFTHGEVRACDMCAKDGVLFIVQLNQLEIDESKIQTLISTMKCMLCAEPSIHYNSQENLICGRYILHFNTISNRLGSCRPVNCFRYL